jgi:hypothetical protein
MKKYFGILFTSLLLIFEITSITYAREYYYYSHGEKIPLAISGEEITIKFKIGISD